MNTLNYFIQSYKLSHGEVSTDNDQKYLQWAVDCLKQLRAWKMMDNAAKWVHLDIQTTASGEKWAHRPADYRRYLWVGSCKGNNSEGFGGRFVSFDLNNDLCDIPPWDMCCCDGEQKQAMLGQCYNGGGGEFDGGLYWGYGGGEPYSYSYSIGSYAIGPGHVGGTFKMDDANNIIRFDRCVNHCVMKYEGDFLTGMGNCYVPPGIEDNMIIQNFMEYRSKVYSPDVNMKREAQGAYAAFYQSVKDYNSQRNALNKDEWLYLIWRFTYQGVKA